MSAKRRRVPGIYARQPAVVIHLQSKIPETASQAQRLTAQLRESAEVSGCCVCGRRPFHFRVLRWGEHPAIERLEEPLPEDEVVFSVYLHESACPAAVGTPQVALVNDE